MVKITEVSGELVAFFFRFRVMGR